LAIKNLHLVCNAHIDPVWLWEWEEGAAAAISTFRTAADLCEQFDTFIFNHNEAILYKWVEEYEPDLFERIQKLVRQKKWHIMGGWFLQPDCNMPSGESFVRQILVGQKYFQSKFGVQPTTAINFDPFGHTRGLVQILAKSGYDSYLFCRPGPESFALPAEDILWEGFDGSKILCIRATSHYNSQLGQAQQKIKNWIQENSEKSPGMVLWGVGNHGGGPSKKDLQDIANLIREEKELSVFHSTPEAYVNDLAAKKEKLPLYANDLNPWAVGCYTSMHRIKQTHRRLENEYFLTEKMTAMASLMGFMSYPREQLAEALADLLTGEFHDILPGSSIQPVEKTSLRLIDHGLEILSRIKARAFFALSSGQTPGAENEIPVLIYNPHPFPVTGVFECEFQMVLENRTGTFTDVHVHQKDKMLPSQVEQERSNLNMDWRKRVVFHGTLQPGQMNRFDCQLELKQHKPEIMLKRMNDKIVFKTNDIDFVINTQTGFVDKYEIHGFNYLHENAFRPIVMQDSPDSWGESVKSFRELAGEFTLMSSEEVRLFAGLSSRTIDPVHIIEDGDVRSVIEVALKYNHSVIWQRYKLPKQGSEVEIEIRVLWNEKDKMLKFSVPTRLQNEEYVGQVAYGFHRLPMNGDEAVAQKWVAVASPEHDLALTCINDSIYGSDYKDGELRLSLLRSPAYSALPIGDREIIPQDRYIPRMDQGEHLYRFWFNAGQLKDRMEAVDREALVKNEKPVVLSFFPSGEGKSPKPSALLSDSVVQITAIKLAEDGDDLIVRLFEPSGRKRTTTLSIPSLSWTREITLNAFEIKTLRIDRQTGEMVFVDLLENEC